MEKEKKTTEEHQAESSFQKRFTKGAEKFVPAGNPKPANHFVLENLIAEAESRILEEINKEELSGSIALRLRNVLQSISNAKRSYEQYLRNK